ncbi:MAG: hypothetical protein KF729_15535 [Sandaracinaceae bacterium]|nr:hypothetical protein [Sandaracinaceae bacterium]
MAFGTPLRLPLSTGDTAFGAVAATGIGGAFAFAPLFFQRYLPDWTFWVALGLVGLWSLFSIGAAFVLWAHRASDVRLDATGLSILSGPQHGRHLAWSELASRTIHVSRSDDETRLTIGEEVLATTTEPDEAASLAALAATLRAGASDRVPDAPLGPEVSKCRTCGAPLVPSSEAAISCAFCHGENVLPDRVRHVAGAAGAGAAVERAVEQLLRWPPAGRSNAWLVLSFVAAGLGWPFFVGCALVKQAQLDTTALDLAVLFSCGLSAALTFPGLLALGAADRRSFELLSARFAAAPPPSPELPYGCRHCGGPLPEPHGRATTPAVAVCAYCESRNLVGLGLAREARAARDDADALTALAAERLSIRRRRRLRAFLPMLVVLASPYQYADVMFQLPCLAPAGRCESETSARWCFANEDTLVRCAGPRGCSRDGLRVFCDQSIAADGDVCLGPTDAVACTPDGASLLRCVGDRSRLVARCRGPRGCFRDADHIRCDDSIAREDEPCEGDSYACAEDGRALLVCRDARWTPLHPADSCALEDGHLVWTGAYAVVGERCAGDSAACAADGRLLRCRDRALAPFAECRGPRGCWSEGTRHFCDQSIAAAGDTCGSEGGACTADGRTFLECRAGTYVVAHECPGGCVIGDGRVSCRRRP